jgi:hypothetical protein
MGSVGRVRGSNFEMPMSALGQKQTLQSVRPMSALPPKADIGTQPRDVRFVPKADISFRRRLSCSVSATHCDAVDDEVDCVSVGQTLFTEKPCGGALSFSDYR